MNQNDIARYRANFQKEIDGAALYRALADSEKQPQMAKVYLKLAASEEKHAAALTYGVGRLIGVSMA